MDHHMGIDAFIFERDSKTCFYFDRVFNFTTWFSAAWDSTGTTLLHPRYESLMTRIERHQDVNADDILYLTEINIEYWLGTEGGWGRAGWNRKIGAFALRRPDGHFFMATDHDAEPWYSHGLIARDGYRQVEEP